MHFPAIFPADRLLSLKSFGMRKILETSAQREEGSYRKKRNCRIYSNAVDLEITANLLHMQYRLTFLINWESYKILHKHKNLGTLKVGWWLQQGVGAVFS